MPSYEELLAHERSMRETVAGGIAEELRALPGVVHVSVGLRERAHKVVNESVIKVYVREKKSSHDLSEKERIPPKIRGLATDVISVGREYDFSADTTRYRPILGGIRITNGNITDVNPSMLPSHGTLGCIATRISDSTPVVLTCAHVLEAQEGAKNDRVFQPDAIQPHLEPADLSWKPRDSTNAIGRVVDFKYTADADAGIASIDVSTCCRCCGVDFSNTINGISQPVSTGSTVKKPPTDGIVGEHVAVKDMIVYKVGQASGRSEGKVVDASGPSVTIRGRQFGGYIRIKSTDATKPFTVKGDSGAAIIDGDGYIVGINFAGDNSPPPDDETLACHIRKVCEAVGVNVNFTPAQTTAAPARTQASRIFRVADADLAAYDAARARLLQHPRAAELYELAELHRGEVVRLVTEHRPVTVAWHRTHGPAFFAHALNAIRDGLDTLPAPINGVSFHAALTRMGEVLFVHGSDDLRTAIAAEGPALLAAVQDSTTIQHVLHLIERADVEVSV